MDTQVIVENEFITIWYHPDSKVVHHKIHKNIFGSAFRDSLSAGTAAMARYGATKWLSDDRCNTVVNKEDEEWGRTVWFTATLKAGWKYWAVIQPEKVLGQMNIKRISETFSAAGITARFFSDPDEGMKWLQSL
jgi:hypothetical protein